MKSIHDARHHGDVPDPEREAVGRTFMNKARTLVAAAAELAKKLANLIRVPFQSNWDVGIGSANGSKMVLNIQPVVPFKLSEDWNLITRYIVGVRAAVILVFPK